MLNEDELIAAMEHERHRSLKIWKDAVAFAGGIYKHTKAFPQEERFGLTSQLRRAAVSVPSNIAEGSKRLAEDNKHFLRYALGSLAECDTQLIIAESLGYGEYTKQLKATIMCTDNGHSRLRQVSDVTLKPLPPGEAVPLMRFTELRGCAAQLSKP